MNRAGRISLLSGCLLMMAAVGARPASPGKHVLISGTYMTSAVQSNLLALGHTSTAFGNIANVNFAGFNAIWLGLGAAGAANRTADLLNFVSAGGIVLVEGSNNSGLSAGLSFTNASGQTIRIIDTNHPVNAGLTAASLSHWGNSWWGYFSAVDGFTGLTDTGTYGQWVTVEKSVGAGHLVFTFQILSHFLENGAGGTGPASPKGIFLDNVLRLAPGTGTNRPTIVLQPQSLTNYTLFPLTLSVAAYGATPLNYRWFKEGTEIPGATNNIFTIGSLHLTNSGNYSVTVSNAYGSPKSAPATVLVLPRPDCAPISEGLISWWRWEKDLTDNWGVSTLLSTSSRSLSFSTGKVGQAISGALIVADSPALRPTNALSIEAWVLPFPSLIQDRRAIVSKYDTSRTATNSGYFLGINENGRLQFSISPNGSSQTINLMSPAVLPVQQWSFVVATYDGSSLRLYLNGALVSQTNHTAGIFPSTADLGLGATSVGIFSWTWNGLLDEVSIYRRGLLPAEISAIYNADISGKCLVPPTITLHPQSQAVPQGEDVQLTVDFSGTRPAHYQWKFMGTNLSGATNAALVLEKLDVNKVGNYSVLVSNIAGTSLSSEASISLLPPPSCIHPLSNAISWWPADGNAFDATGSNDLPFAAYSPGKAKQAFLLNGYTSRFQVPSATALNFGSNADFSIEAWIKALPPPPQSTTNPNVPIVEKRIGTGLNYGTGYSLSLYQGRLAFWLGAASSQPLNQALYVSPGPDLRDRMFHHVAVTLNRGLTNGGKLYLDGQLIHTFDPSARRGSLVNNGLFYLGGPASPVGNSYFNGLIDEVAVYDRALSAAEILNLRSAGAAGKCKVLPVVISQPVSQVVTIGSNVTFSVGVGGPSRLRYQWLRGLAVIAGATNESYTFNVQSGSAGSYSVRVSNAFGSILSSNALLTVNHRPSALPLALATEEDTALNLTLLGSDPEGSVLAFAVVQPPAHGQLSGLPPNLIYSPETNFNGNDSFTFTVHDGLAASASGTVKISVRPVNDAPLASAQSVATSEDTGLPITLLAADPDGDLIVYELVEAPVHGTLSGTVPTLIYQPATNYFGPDQIVFQVRDRTLQSSPATVAITVHPVNDAPFALARVAPLWGFSQETNRWIVSLNNSNALVRLDGSASFDVEEDPLNFAWFEGSDLVAAGQWATNTFEVGFHSIELQVTDGAATGSFLVDFEVITPATSIGMMMLWIDEAGLASRRAQPLLASLIAAASAFDRGSIPAGLSQLDAFRTKVSVQIAPEDPDLARRLDEAVRELLKAWGR